MSSAGDLTLQRKLKAIPVAPATVVSHSWDTRSAGDRTERLAKKGECCDPLYNPPPNAPTILRVEEGDGYLDVHFAAPRALAIRHYTVKITPDVSGESVPDVIGIKSPIRVSGLVNGNTYQVVIHATNSVGMGVPSEPHAQKRPKTKPAIPRFSAEPQNGKIHIEITEPATGGMPILYYTIKRYTTTDVFVEDLSSSRIADVAVPNGSAWKFAVSATNEVGESPLSDLQGPFMAITAPDTPHITIVPKAGALDVTLQFGANGGSPLTHYVWRIGTSDPTLVEYTNSTVTFTISNLPNGTQQTVYAQIFTQFMQSGEVFASATPANAPPAPSIVAYGEDQRIRIEFIQDSDGGSPITQYLYSLNGASYRPAAELTSPLSIPDLSNGVTYTVAIKAVNAVGQSPPTATYVTTPGAGDIIMQIKQTGQSLQWSPPPGVTSVRYLVVGGGGGGGGAGGTGSGGGGGGGSVKEGNLILSATAYECYVGVGGSVGPSTNGGSGEASRFGPFISAGGGGGYQSRATHIPQPNGIYCQGGAGQNGDTGTIGGNGGGHREDNLGGGPAPGVGGGGGGGGGAGGPGSNGYDATPGERVAINANGGAGGLGVSSSITRASKSYGAGGKGGDESTSDKAGTPGAQNTGTGGEGAMATSWGRTSVSGGAGGSGVVILSYTFST